MVTAKSLKTARELFRSELNSSPHTFPEIRGLAGEVHALLEDHDPAAGHQCARPEDQRPESKKARAFHEVDGMATVASKLQAAKQLVERHAQSDEKLAELPVMGGHRVEAHFVNDRFDIEGIVGKQRHAPFPIIEAG